MRHFIRALSSVTAATLLLLPPVDAVEGSAAVGDAAQGALIFHERCEKCHRAEGDATGGRAFPVLAGQKEKYLLEQMVQFVKGDRVASKMHEILGEDLANPQTLRDLSTYLSAQRREMHNEHGDAHRLGLGHRIYDDRCARCHGTLGDGGTNATVPAIIGQNYTYLVAQLRGFAAGHRSSVNPGDIDAVAHLSPNDVRAVADFMSRMPENASAR